MSNHPLSLRNSTLRSSLRKHHGERQKSPGRKTVCFCSNGDKKVSTVADCLEIMKSGTDLIKLRTNVKQFCRVFTLDADLSCIRWTPTTKKPHKARISVDSIKEVRTGRNTELLRATENNTADLQDECAFSIIHGPSFECLDLIAQSVDDAKIWTTGLMALMTSSQPDHQSPEQQSLATIRERWLGSVFDEADKDKNGCISEKTAARKICELNPRLALRRVKQKVKEASAFGHLDDQRGRIVRDQFVEIYTEISTRSELYFLMLRYANDYMSVENLQTFLETEQGMIGVDRQMCERLIDQFEPAPEAKQRRCLTVDGFTQFLLSNHISDRTVCNDMNRPFNEYFIASSHRSYLVEDQNENGPSSLDGFETALRRGCRFIEVSICDPTDEDEPVVCQSNSSVSKIRFSSVLRTLEELAFERSQWPIFIHLDVHCCTKYQLMACDQLKSMLGSKLYEPKKDPTDTDWTNPANVPTPAHFVKKVLLVSTGYMSRSNEFLATHDRENCDLNRQRLCSQLLDLIPAFGRLHCIDDSFTRSQLKAGRIFSISESNCLRFIQKDSATFNYLIHNFLLMITPSVHRVDSSNLNPIEFWIFGVNFCLLNYQTPGLMLDLEQGMFSASGNCGYVLKPEIMKDEIFSPVDKMPFVEPQVLHLRVISAQQLPRPRGSNAKGDSTDPFVVVEIFGIPTDCAEDRTKTVRNDSFNPSFEESFQFEVSIPELALVRWLILDDEYIDDDFIGSATIPFVCLQSGYRHIPLLNNEGDPLENSSLFVHIAVTNRRGGGKPRKRGSSLRRPTRVQTGLKQNEIKAADELSKNASTALVESIEMRNNFESGLSEWQKLLGIWPTGSVRQGFRLLHNRIVNAAAEISSSTLNPDNPPFLVEQFEDEGKVKLAVRSQVELPDSVQKCFESFENLLNQCDLVSKNMLEKFSESVSKISDFYTDISHHCTEAGLYGQKAQRATENFAWNVRLLKAQFGLALKTQSEAKEMLQQVVETAKSFSAFRCAENSIKV